MQAVFHDSYEAWVMTLEPMSQFARVRILEEKVKLEKQIRESEARIIETGSTPQRESVLQDKNKRLREILLHIKYR